MIRVTPDIKRRYPPAFAAARKAKFRVVWLEDDLVYVARRGKGHERYLVQFVMNGAGQVLVGCRTTTNRECYGCKFKEMCSHIAIVIERWQKKRSRTTSSSLAA